MNKRALTRGCFRVTAVLAGMACASRAAILVSPAGSGVLAFDVAPPASEWSTGALPYGTNSIHSEADLDAAVQLFSAADIANALPTSATLPPSTYGAGARWNSSGHFLQTRPAGTPGVVLMATFLNNTGADLTTFAVSYQLGLFNPPGFEELPG